MRRPAQASVESWTAPAIVAAGRERSEARVTCRANRLRCLGDLIVVERFGGRGALAALAVVAACAAGAPHRALALGDTAFADMRARDGREVGRIEMVETVSGVLLKVKLRGLPPGPKGFHVHETGTCDGDFRSAGKIYNPLGGKHGFLHEEGPMVGDLPNLIVGQTGEVEVELISPFLTLSKDSEESLRDADGSALLIKEGPDDYRSQPAGKSGAAIACGIVSPAR